MVRVEVEGVGVLGAIHSLIREELSQQKGVGWVCCGGGRVEAALHHGSGGFGARPNVFFPDCRRRAAHPRMHLVAAQVEHVGAPHAQV